MVKSSRDKNARREPQRAGEEKRLLFDPESELRLFIGGRERKKRRAKVINGMKYRRDMPI